MTWDAAFGSGIDPADTAAPLVVSVAPLVGSAIGPGDAIAFTVTDDEAVANLSIFADSGGFPTVYRAGALVYPYSGAVDTANPEAVSVSITRILGWTATASVTVVATDVTGNELVLVLPFGVGVGVLNPSFEIAGASPGLAASWTITAVGSAFEIATFATDAGAGVSAVESFEGAWDTNEDYLYELTDPVLEAAVFDDGTFAGAEVERFEKLWDSNESYTYAPALEQASFHTAPQGFEDFEAEWDTNEGYLFAFGGGDVVAATFGATAFEPFEAGWSSNDSLYLYAFSGGDLSAASYDTVPEAFEDFAEDWTLTMTTV